MIESPATFGALAGALGVADTVPYLRDTLRRSTVPHRGSWLIWGVLEVVAVEAQRADGARWSLVPLVAQAVGTCLVFALSLRLGSGGVSRLDLALILLAAAGVAGWLAVDEPVIAITCVITADLLAAAMMLPKTWREPHSETLSTFVLAALGGAMMVGAVGSRSLPLLVYPIYFTLVNAVIAGAIHYRRECLRPAGSHRAKVVGTLSHRLPAPSRRRAQRGHLLVEGQRVSLDCRGKAALRREAQLIQRHLFCRLIDAPIELVLVLQSALLGGDQTEHDALARRHETQRLETTRALVVVFKKEAIDRQLGEQRLGH